MPSKANPISLARNCPRTRCNSYTTGAAGIYDSVPAYYVVTTSVNVRSASVAAPSITQSDDQNFITRNAESLSQDEAEQVITKAYKRRFWILFIFSILIWFCCVQWNTWGPISESVFNAFPDWSSSTIAMMENWVSFMFVICVLPVCWVTDRIGLRLGVLISALLFAVGLALRCITDKSPFFTIMCHLCSVLLGISMTLILSAPPMIASVWFPQNERTSAVAVMMAVATLGNVGSYLEPLLVRDPSSKIPSSYIRQDIMLLMYLGAGISSFLFLLIMAYFPSRPPLPPSFTSSTERLNFKDGLTSIIRNRTLLVLIIIYGVAVGPSLGWVGVLNFSLKPLGFTQREAMYIGIVAVLACFIVTLIIGWFTDRLYGHLRETVIALLLTSALSYYWFLLLYLKIIPVVTWQVFVSVALGLSLNYAAIPIFFEMAVEVAYPVHEVLVGGVVTASDSLSTTIFLFFYFIESIGFDWVVYTLVASNGLAVVALLFIKTGYSRYTLDSPQPRT